MSQTIPMPVADLRTYRAAALRAKRARALADLAERRSRIDAGHSVMYRREALRLRAMAAEWERGAGIPAARVG